MTNTREFPTSVIASLSSGILLCKFSDMHEAAEYLMGHPIWTHHFASKPLWKSMQEKILAQHPDMPTQIPGLTKDDVQDEVEALEKRLGKTVKIAPGNGETAMGPLEGIPDGKPVVILKTDGAA